MAQKKSEIKILCQLKVKSNGRFDDIYFHSAAEICEAIEVLVRALKDAVMGESPTSNYVHEPVEMAANMVLTEDAAAYQKRKSHDKLKG